KSSKPLTSFSGSNLNPLAFSSQKGVPVSGLKCQRTTSRTWTSSLSLASFVWAAVALAVTVVLVSLSSLAHRDRVARRSVVQVQNAVGDHGRHLQRRADGDLLRRGQVLAGLEDVQVARVVAEEHLAVHVVGRAPGLVLEVVLPLLLAGPGVQALQVAHQLG